MLRNTHHDIRNTNHIRCDNCFFSSWMLGPCRPALTCKQRVRFVGRRRMVLPDASCANFYPSSTFKAGSAAVRRIPLTRGKFALVDAANYYQLAKFRWYAEICGRTFYAARVHARKVIKMHRYIMKAPGHLVVDHIDHNGLNNTKSNLRLCTTAQNNRNAALSFSSTSRYKGVHWNRGAKKWAAKIKLNAKSHHLGYFTDEIAAARAYDEKAKELHGEFACLNFPPSVIPTEAEGSAG